MSFNKKQIEFMEGMKLGIDFNNKLSEDDYVLIEDKIADKLQEEGFIGKEYENVNEIGKMCESILDAIE